MSDTLRAVEAQALSEPFTAPDIHYRPGDRELLLVTLQASLAINRLVVSGLNYDRPYDRKADDSPATVTDRACEEVARQMYEDAFGQSVAFMGEEGGGESVLPWIPLMVPGRTLVILVATVPHSAFTKMGNFMAGW